MDPQTDGRLLAWIEDEGVYGWVVRLGAHVSKLNYSVGGIKYEVYLENDDFVLVDEEEED